jgi:hypothetical protein
VLPEFGNAESGGLNPAHVGERRCHISRALTFSCSA